MPSWQTYKGLSVPDTTTGDAGTNLKADIQELADRNGGAANFAATSNPGVSNDVTQGYYPGSRWLNTTTKKMWTCVDNTASAAAWSQAGDPIDVYENGALVLSTASRLDFKDLNVENPSGSVAALYLDLPVICNGRLTLTSGTPVTTSDVTAATTVYWTPYCGSKVALYDGTRWKLYAFTERSLSIPSAVFRLYDVYLYDSSGTLTLEATAWDSGGQTSAGITGGTNAAPVVITSNSHGLSVGDLVGINSMGGLTSPNGKIWYVSAVSTNTFTLEGAVGNAAYTSGGTWYKVPTTRTTALTSQDGVYVKSGNSTRRYLGTLMTTSASGQSEDSKSRRLLWNRSNRVGRALLAVDRTDIWTYTTGAYRAANANTDAGVGQCQIVRGLNEDIVTFSNEVTAYHSTGGVNAAVGIGRNRTTVNSACVYNLGGLAVANVSAHTLAVYSEATEIGYSFLQRIEYANASSGVMTWTGDAGTPFHLSGAYGAVFA